MGIWKRLFGDGKPAGDPGSREGGTQQYMEKHDKGTRQETASQATAYWMARNMSQKFDPFVMYVFDQENDARDALLELDCMRLAEDSGKIICLETLVYGFYKREDGKYEALVCGDELSHDVWEAARASFAKHGGVKKNEQEPAKTEKAPAVSRQGDPKQVKFVREDRTERMGHTMIYRIHKGPDGASARAFLEENPVSQGLYYIVVETPEGNYCRDKDGIYKE